METFQIDVRFVFNPEAEPHKPDVIELREGWKSPAVGTTPLQGDLVSFGDGDDAPMFEVQNRLFMWKKSDHLIVQLLLGLLPQHSRSRSSS